MKTDRNEIYVHVFFVDIVKLSDPKLGDTIDQTKKIEIMSRFIEQTKIFKNSKDDILINNTGDGAVICFKDNLRGPYELAIQLHQKLQTYNRDKKPKNRIQVRIGINSGIVMVHKGIGNPKSFWGRGIINAARIMGFAGPKDILIESGIAKELKNLSKQYDKEIQFAGTKKIKHDAEELEIYYAHGTNFGNRNKPKLGTIEKISPKKEYRNVVLDFIKKSAYTKRDLVQKKRKVMLDQKKSNKTKKMKKNKKVGRVRK